MKYLKYGLFIVFIYFWAINIINAEVCTYTNGTFEYTCEIKNNQVNCEMACVGANCTNFNWSNVTNSFKVGNFCEGENFKCPSAIKVAQSTINGIVTYSEATFVGNGATLNYAANKSDLEGNACKSSSGNGTTGSTDNKKYDGKTCNYKNSNGYEIYQYSCTISNGSPKCQMYCLNNSICGQDNLNYKNELTINDFVKNNEFTCPNVIYEKDHVVSSTSSFFATPYSFSSDKKEDNPGSSAEKDPSAKPTEGKETTFDTKTFCQGRVLGAFTTIGWIFFILKIVIPIILVLFATIDFSKAVIASKDDEIKKAAIKIIKRSILGIIIFFIPTFLRLVINIFDNDDLAFSEFSKCTKCMLSPNDDSLACKASLFEEE